MTELIAKRVGNEVIQISIKDSDREMTDQEWEQYVAYVRFNGATIPCWRQPYVNARLRGN